jgi:mannosyltransferase OCH1-like enzyme
LIPKRIYQTQEFEYVPEGMRAAMQSIIDLNPDFGYKYYSDQRARDFIVKHMDPRTVRAFDILIPGAYRADLFRYVLLYVKGGIYIDSSMLGVTPLDQLIDPTDVFIAPVDMPSVNKEGTRLGIYNAFMCATPRHPVILQTLDLVLDRIDARDIGPESLYMTGPLALGGVFAASYGINDLVEGTCAEGVRLISHIPGAVKTGDTIMLYTKYTNYRKETKQYNSGEHYGALWRRGEVFAREPPVIPLGFSYKPFCPNGIGWDPHTRKIPSVDPSLQLKVPVQKVHPSIRSINQLIPAVIHQTHEFDHVPVGMRDAMDTIIQFNSGYDHIYYNAADRHQFIADHMDARALRCYESLIPGAYQSDFFRYAVLYYRGGIYLDAGSEALAGLEGIIDPTDQFVGTVDNCGTNICNAFIGAVPHHPILGAAIELMLDRIEKQEYGPSDLWITGPRLLRDAFERVVKHPIREQRYPQNIKLVRYKIDPRCSSGVIKAGDVHYFNNKYPSYRSDMTWYCPTENYAVLWAERRVYRK